eukprot:CAMPEP_0197541016 /NCGR_PEP_ID=MMETSP1318-20131121/66919_1 /TAXON_ID=552666 /ORGANISM="Partenskyella glossopodia, Strain RCC365" /LENGTH=233 /DNA_ID=CAMNT_0043100141 /DNA_START=62 /DNA_END=763 /DNA_ORIENTATION=+
MPKRSQVYALLASLLLATTLSVLILGRSGASSQGELGSSLAQMRTTHMHAQRGLMGLRGASMAGKRHQRMADVLSPNSMALSPESQKRLDGLGLQSERVEPKKTVFYQVPDSVPQLGDKYAVVEVGGTQVIVEEGRWYTVRRLKANVGDIIRLPRVLLMKMGQDKVQLGLPYLEEGVVEAQVVEHLRGDKLDAGKYKPKKHYRRRWGVRDELTKFVVTKIHSDQTEFLPSLDA